MLAPYCVHCGRGESDIGVRLIVSDLDPCVGTCLGCARRLIRSCGEEPTAEAAPAISLAPYLRAAERVRALLTGNDPGDEGAA